MKSEDMQIGLFANPMASAALEQSRLDAFAALLRHGQTRFQVLADIQLKRWEKVVWNAAWNSLTTLTMVDTQTWLHSSDDAEPLTRTLMREVIAVGQRCGVAGLRVDLVDELLTKINALPPIGSSMQTDAKNGRPIEIDAILGFPLRKARQFGLQTPVLETIYVILRGLDVGLRKRAAL